MHCCDKYFWWKRLWEIFFSRFLGLKKGSTVTTPTVQGLPSVPSKFLQKTRLFNRMQTKQRFNFHCRNDRLKGAFCAKGQKETHGTCKGDSGPYFCMKNGKFYLVGMKSKPEERKAECGSRCSRNDRCKALNGKFYLQASRSQSKLLSQRLTESKN